MSISGRALGGGSDLLNLGVAHARCNGEKGRRWDPRRRHRRVPDAYTALVGRLLAERARRWRAWPDRQGADDMIMNEMDPA